MGDPALIMIPPTEQFLSEYLFLTPNKYANDYVTIVSPQTATVTLDGTPLSTLSFTNISGSAYKVARMSVTDGVHTISATAPVGVVVYGYDKDVSYGYTAGIDFSGL